MTIGKRIKYLRTQLGITQDQLAQMTGIHPVSIRKYETDKTKPQPAQIERIASALGVGRFALSDINKEILSIENQEDLLGLVMLLCNAGVLQITGKRNSDNMIEPETVKIQLGKEITPILPKLLIWEKSNYWYQNLVATLGDETNTKRDLLLSNFEEAKGKIELDLQRKAKNDGKDIFRRESCEVEKS